MVEVVLLSTVMIAAMLAMGGYVKRGLSGAYRSATNSIGEQYDPRHTSTTPGGFVTTVVNETRTESKLQKEKSGSQDVNVMVTKTTILRDDTLREGEETVAPPRASIWER